jgi:hypothetical protein
VLEALIEDSEGMAMHAVNLLLTAAGQELLSFDFEA